MDGVSVAANIVGIATAGAALSIKLVTLATQISTAAERVSSIGSDISLTSGVLHQLGELMTQKTTDDGISIFSQGKSCSYYISYERSPSALNMSKAAWKPQKPQPLYARGFSRKSRKKFEKLASRFVDVKGLTAGKSSYQRPRKPNGHSCNPLSKS